MKINTKLLPVKAHFFFFMAAMGPILPQLQVYGKELGISPVVMGTVTGILPFAFLLAKPAFGMLVDVYRSYRKTIFIAIIFLMTASYALIAFIPVQPALSLDVSNYSTLNTCKTTDLEEEKNCNNITKVECASNCTMHKLSFLVENERFFCALDKNFTAKSCDLTCEKNSSCIYKTVTFWSFIVFMSVGTVGFNIVNAISDAICFDVGKDSDYGVQRVWGTIGFGLTALISGYLVEIFSENTQSYIPAIIIMVICSIIDIPFCVALKIPIIPPPENIFKDLSLILKEKKIVVFIIFTVMVGMLDSILVYYLFWFLEDLALSTQTRNIKFIEGLIVAAETLGGEIVFFPLADTIIKWMGHANCFTMCFLMYALRLGLISLVSSPWWILPIELFMQGPTYAVSYTLIVKYADQMAFPGTSATIQGIATGMGDGTGYALGSILGGILYKYLGGKYTLQIFSILGAICSLFHFLIHRYYVEDNVKKNRKDEYEPLS